MAKARYQIKTWGQALPKNGVVMILGHRERGKSALGWWLGERGHKADRKVGVFHPSVVSARLLPKWVARIPDFGTLQQHRNLIVLVDEASLEVAARNHASSTNILWSQLVAICRHKGHLLVFISQHTRQADVLLIGDADLVIWKLPSILHIRFSRPEFREEVEEAQRVLEKFGDGKTAKSWCWVKEWLHGKTGLLRNGVPSFWSEELSKSFALVELEIGEEKGKSKPAPKPKRVRVKSSARPALRKVA